jgi:tetrahydromethanopterin S-methyltransferase subunit G
MIDFTSVVVSVLTAGGTVGVARAARRTPRQEKRDDFETVTRRLDKDIERLETRIARQDTQIAGQTSAIGMLSGWVRTLVIFTRAAGLEPPPQPFVPEEARPYLHDIGV